MLAGVLLVVLLVVLGAVTASEVVPEWFLAVIVWRPLVVGLALVVGHRPRTRYAFALGLLRSRPLGLIVSTGLCLGARERRALPRGARTTPFFRVG